MESFVNTKIKYFNVKKQKQITTKIEGPMYKTVFLGYFFFYALSVIFNGKKNLIRQSF